MRSTIICVDDEKLLLNILYDQLDSWFGKHYIIEKAQTATEALTILDNCISSGRDVSVFISDYIMPLMKGDELLTKVKERDPKIKRIMLTGYSAIDGIVNAINKAGIYRYISKPWDGKDLMLTLLEAIKSYEQDKINSELSKNYESLYYKYEKLYNEKEENYDALLKSFALACDLRDQAKTNHSERVAKYAETIGRLVSLPDAQLKTLVHSALLHDAGKLAMSDEELQHLKTSKKYDSDFISMRSFQANFSTRIIEKLTASTDFVENVKYQFETYDGVGPFNLKGENIPVGARILHIANLYDVVSASMKDSSIEEKIAEFVKQGNTHLDNQLTSLFVEQLKKQN